MQFSCLLPLAALLFGVWPATEVCAQNSATSAYQDVANDTGSDRQESAEFETTTEVENTTRDLFSDLEPIMKDIQRRLYPAFSELIGDENMSTECIGSLLSLLKGVQDAKKWALMIATASGSLPQNLFLGAQGTHGSYDQCLEAKRLNFDGVVDLRGQYCNLLITPTMKMFESIKALMADDLFFKRTLLKMKEWPKALLGVPTGFKIGVCVPDHCSVDDLNYALEKMINRVYGLDTTFDSCRTKQEKVPNTFQRIVIAFGFVLLALVISGTLTDSYLNRSRDKPQYINPSFPITFAMMFSARRNVKWLFSPYTPEAKELGFLNGIKVLLSCWVVYGHNAIFVSPDVFYSLSNYVQLLKKPIFQVVLNGFMSVSSFFFISGFLLAYLCFKDQKRILKRNPSISICIMFIRRYFRLVLPLLVVVCFSMLMDLWADSPNDQKSVFNIYTRSCPNTWWSIPALTSNFMGARAMCLGQSWYVAVDMQVFVVAAFLVMVILSHPRVGLSLTIVLIFFSCIWVAVATYMYEYSPIISFTGFSPQLIEATFDYIYAQPITHAGCYLLGVICAYVCFYKATKLQWYTQIVMWVLAHGCASYVVFITVFWYRDGIPAAMGTALYAGFHRVTFTLGLFWLIYACLHGMAPNTRRILEHSAFRVLGRLAFGIYLVHFAVVFMHQGLMKNQHFYPDQFLILQSTLGVLGISFALAFLMSIAVERPIAHLDNFIFKKLTKKTIEEPQNAKGTEINLGPRAEVALVIEQQCDHWRQTPTKNGKGARPANYSNGTAVGSRDCNSVKNVVDKTRL